MDNKSKAWINFRSEQPESMTKSAKDNKAQVKKHTQYKEEN
jgi:hypothetical protein